MYETLINDRSGMADQWGGGGCSRNEVEKKRSSIWEK